jgi:SAM-dependent methyltransferase
VRTHALPLACRPDAVLARALLAPPTRSFDGPTGERYSRELFAALLEHRSGPGATLLDLGCGPRDQAGAAEHCGYRYVGLDYGHAAADIRGDAHALPLRSSSIDVVFSFAVLEHLHSPFLAMAEVRRVLVPGGLCVGTVSLGEPFHDSFFHLTPWGLAALAAAAGLSIVRLWPSGDALHALATMGHYSRAVRSLLKVLLGVERHLPALSPRRWLRWTEREVQFDACARAAALCFVLRREDRVAEAQREPRSEGSA